MPTVERFGFLFFPRFVKFCYSFFLVHLYPLGHFENQLFMSKNTANPDQQRNELWTSTDIGWTWNFHVHVFDVSCPRNATFSQIRNLFEK